MMIREVARGTLRRRERDGGGGVDCVHVDLCTSDDRALCTTVPTRTILSSFSLE
jgi:hypothetical protein